MPNDISDHHARARLHGHAALDTEEVVLSRACAVGMIDRRH
ncbi:MAG: hypothetical protein ACREFJ_09365 [Acetobacteraceae bacterium]